MERRGWVSGEEVADDAAADVGEAEVAAGVAVGEAFVIEAEEVEDGGVEVVDVDGVHGGAEAEFVGGSVGGAAFGAAAGEPDAEAVGVVVAAFGGRAGFLQLDGGGAAEFAAEEDEGVVEHPALAEVIDEGGDGLIDLAGEGGVFGDIVVIVPRLAGAVPELDEADAAFEEAAGDEGLAGVDAGAVGVADVLGFAAGVEGVGGFHLHAEGEFEALDAGFEAGVAGALALVFAVEFEEEVELFALLGGRGVVAADVFDEFLDAGLLRVDERALVDTGEEAGLPVFAVLDRITAGAHGDEAGEVLIFRAESVGDPGAEAGSALDGVTAVHEHEGWLVIRDVGLHGADDGEVVGAAGDVGENVADLEAALAVRREFEGRGKGRACLAFGAEVGGGQGLAGKTGEGGLGVKGVHMRRAAVEEKVDDAFGFRSEVRRARGEGIGVGCEGGGGRGVCVGEERGGFAEETGEREGTHAHAAAEEEIAAGKSACRAAVGEGFHGSGCGRCRGQGRQFSGRDETGARSQ